MSSRQPCYSRRENHYRASVKNNFELQAKLVDDSGYLFLIGHVCGYNDAPDFKRRNIGVLCCLEKLFRQRFSQQRRFSLFRFVDERSVLGNDVANKSTNGQTARRSSSLLPPS